MKFKVAVPGKLRDDLYGKNYYAIQIETKELIICGDKAPEYFKKRYEFWFDEQSAAKYEIDYLPRENEQ